MADTALIRLRLGMVLSFLVPAAFATLLLVSELATSSRLVLAAQALLVCVIGAASAVVTRAVVRRSRAVQAVLVSEVLRRERAEAELLAAARDLERRSAFLGGLVNTAGVEIVAVDQDGNSALWNGASRAAYGVTGSDEEIGRAHDWAERFAVLDAHGEPLAADRLPLVRALHGESVRGESLIIATSGQPPRHLIANADTIVLPSGEVLGAVVASLDVTVLKAREAELQRVNRDLDAVARAKTAIMAGTDARQAVCRAALEVTGSIVSLLMEPTPDRTELIATATTGIEVPVIAVPIDAPSRVATAFRTGQVQLVPNVRTDAVTNKGSLASLDAASGDGPLAQSAIYIPVVRDGVVRAVLIAVMAEQVALGDLRLLALLDMLAADAALALEREDLLRRLSGEALTDPLTGLPNRRAWDDALAREIARAGRAGTALTVAVLDLDHFKRFNDAFGHPAGDALLASAATHWRDQVRAGDTVARLGGEEFGVILPDCSGEHAELLITRLLADLPFEQTASAGVAEWAGDSVRDLLSRADQALYRSKADGRARLTRSGT